MEGDQVKESSPSENVEEVKIPVEKIEEKKDIVEKEEEKKETPAEEELKEKVPDGKTIEVPNEEKTDASEEKPEKAPEEKQEEKAPEEKQEEKAPEEKQEEKAPEEKQEEKAPEEKPDKVPEEKPEKAPEEKPEEPKEAPEPEKVETSKEQEVEAVKEEAKVETPKEETKPEVLQKEETVEAPEEKKQDEVKEEEQKTPETKEVEEKDESPKEELKTEVNGEEPKEEDQAEQQEDRPDDEETDISIGGSDSVESEYEEDEAAAGRKVSKKRVRGRGAVRYYGDDEAEEQTGEEQLEDYEDEEEGPVVDEDDEGEEGKPREEDEEEGAEGDNQKPVDDDQDRRKPQYIPKSGPFYQHDMRQDEENPEEDEKKEDPRKRKPREMPDRWTHDKYDEKSQAPKTTEELMDQYGFDIRKDETAPKAHRQRKYGRGPSKYDRNWEDTDAYRKPRGAGVVGTERGRGRGRGRGLGRPEGERRREGQDRNSFSERRPEQSPKDSKAEEEKSWPTPEEALQQAGPKRAPAREKSDGRTEPAGKGPRSPQDKNAVEKREPRRDRPQQEGPPRRPPQQQPERRQERRPYDDRHEQPRGKQEGRVFVRSRGSPHNVSQNAGREDRGRPERSPQTGPPPPRGGRGRGRGGFEGRGGHGPGLGHHVPVREQQPPPPQQQQQQQQQQHRNQQQQDYNRPPRYSSQRSSRAATAGEEGQQPQQVPPLMPGPPPVAAQSAVAPVLNSDRYYSPNQPAGAFVPAGAQISPPTNPNNRFAAGGAYSSPPPPPVSVALAAAAGHVPFPSPPPPPAFAVPPPTYPVPPPPLVYPAGAPFACPPPPAPAALFPAYPAPHPTAEELYSNGMAYYDPSSQFHSQVHVARPIQKRPKAAIPIVAPPGKAEGAGDGQKVDARDEQRRRAVIMQPSRGLFPGILPAFVFLILCVNQCSVDGLIFYLEAGPGTSKCLSDQVHKDVLVVGMYNVTEVPGHAVDLTVIDGQTQTLVSRTAVSGGRFVFIHDDEDMYQICFVSRIADTRIPVREGAVHEVSLDIKHGVEAKSYEGMKQTAKLQEMEVELRRLEDLSESIKKDFDIMKEREVHMRDTNESTNARVLGFSVFGLLWLLCVASWQVYHLLGYFKAKKLIE